jgi:hypothetical protein
MLYEFLEKITKKLTQNSYGPKRFCTKFQKMKNFMLMTTFLGYSIVNNN